MSLTRVVGIPKEIKTHEYRVSMTPRGVQTLTHRGVRVLVEKGAGEGAGFMDNDYVRSGAKIACKEDVFHDSNLIVKVKEPQPSEYDLIKRDQVVFTFFHFAGVPGLEAAMKERGAICFAYETVKKSDGTLPILAPMSEVAGRLAVQEGMRFLSRNNGGSGILLSGVPGVEPANVVVIGGGIVGTNAAQLAAGLGAKVFLLDNNIQRLRQLAQTMPTNVYTIFSTPSSIHDYLSIADLAVGAVLIPGKETPKIVSVDMLKDMKVGSVFVDVAIDQGGITPLSTPTSHDNPVFKVAGVTMYCVANMPGIVPYTSTQALANATLPYVDALATKGWVQACDVYPELGVSLLV
jgi:alanine dehydrogenase